MKINDGRADLVLASLALRPICVEGSIWSTATAKTAQILREEPDTGEKSWVFETLLYPPRNPPMWIDLSTNH